MPAGPIPHAMQRLHLVWPLPALLVWAAAWAVAWLSRESLSGAAAVGLGTLVGCAGAAAVHGFWRRGVVAAGFPLSVVMLAGTGAVPAWVWLLPLLLLLAVYPLRAWQDAPVFPTPAGALDALSASITLAPGAQVLDAGCGAGDGLRALHRAWPHARLAGVEWSWPLVLIASWRCRGAQVRRGDMWAQSWTDLALVYLFQRPETMARAWAKALAEMRPGAWFVSLEFEVPGVPADIEASLAGDRRIRAWRIPAQPRPTGADNTPVTPASTRDA